MKKSILTICFILITSTFIKLFAQDAGLSIQGVLRTVENTAVENGQYNLTFRLYNVRTGGTALWEETLNDTDVKGGIYSVILGKVNTLNVPFNEKYFLGVSVEGGGELIPRAELTSSPYALSLIGEDNIFPNSGNVGIGDSDPAQKLTIKNGTGRIGLDTETNAGYSTSIVGEEDEVSFDNDGSNKDFSFKQNGNERIRVRHHGLNMKGDGSAYFDIEAATSRALVGFTDANSSIMNIHNTDGEIRYTANFNKFYGKLYAYNGINVQNERSYFYEKVDINVNGRSLTSVGTNHSYLAFYPKTVSGGELGKIGYLTANTDALSIRNSASNGNIQLVTSSGDIVLTPGSNREVVANGQLRLLGHKTMYNTSYHYLFYSNGVGSHNGANVPNNFALYADQKIRALGFYAVSDSRIKKDLKISNQKADLATLNKLEVTDYRHIDELEHGTEFKKGLIAQQVATVFPEAVTYSTDVIPNIFEFPKKIQLENNVATFFLSKTHDLKKGDQLKVITDKGAEMVTVSTINDPKSFSISNWSGNDVSKEVFVYGKEIDDFHTVDYDRVFTLAVSATQELARKVEALEKENAQLKSNALKVDSDYKADLDTINKRIKALENMLTSISSN